MFGIWEILLILGVLFAVTFGGGIVLLGVRALSAPPREGEDDEAG